jgi:hypothetical protein
MKNMRKILMSAFGIALLLTACSEDYPERTESYKPASDVMSVYFPSSEGGTVEITPTATTYEVKVSRMDSTKAAVIPLKKSYDISGLFTIPSSVTFAAGQKDATVQITFPDLVDFRLYPIGLELDETYTNPYDSLVIGTSKLALTITQTDWTNYAVGEFTSEFFDGSWSQTLQYSKILKRYKLTDLYATGYGFQFSWDGSAAVDFVGETATGYIDSDYGMIYATGDSDPKKSFYVADSKSFTFNIEFTVSAGSFGAYNEVFVITQKY